MTISSGVPGPGAGTLEAVSSQDRYEFVVPDGGRRIGVDPLVCLDGVGADRLPWSIEDASTGTVVLHPSGYCARDSVHLVAGSYVLVVTGNEHLTPGDYELSLSIAPEPEVFAVSVDDRLVVSPGEPGPGAGSLETVFSQDHFAFTIPDNGTEVAVSFGGVCPQFGRLRWSVIDMTLGTEMLGSSGCITELGVLDSGDYVLTIGDSNATVPGDYELTVEVVPPPDAFDVEVTVESPVTISPGVPGPGAGTLETMFAEDRYGFVVPEGGARVGVDPVACLEAPGYDQLPWSIEDASTGEAVFTPSRYCLRDAVDLPAGAYVLVVAASEFLIPGDYELTLSITPVPDVFDVSLEEPVVISPGVPGPGARILETGFSQDRYEFDVPEGGGRVGVDPVVCLDAAGSDQLPWTIEDAVTGEAIFTPSRYCRRDSIEVPAGRYVLVVAANSQVVPGDYELTLMIAPPPDVFDVSLEDPVAISPGVPGPGPGSLETVFSQDHYAFTIASDGTALTLSFGACPDTSRLRWAILDASTGEQTYFSATCTDRTRVLDAGDYVLVTGYDNQTVPGDYEVILTASEP